MIKRLRSIDELTELRSALLAQPTPDVEIRVCSTGCRALGALEVCDAFQKEITDRGLGGSVRVVRTGCHGLCAGAVAVVVDPEGIFYQGVTADDVPEIIEKTIGTGEPVERLCWSSDGQTICHQQDIPFYKYQTRLVLRNCGVIDPRSLEDALRHGAYSALVQVLSEMSPEQVINEVSASGLRGRGGAGFPTGRKWGFTRAAVGQPKYIICNADEGDPGAFMDRALLEGDPHLVIEGMIIGAYAIGATQGVIYVRAEYPIAIEHTRLALAEAREAGLLGTNILGTGFDFDVEIRQGAGAFVCGEETALIASVEGKRGVPRPRPPFPANSGLYGKPTNINNVETWGNVPRIIEKGADVYAAIGTDGSKGTKIFALAGKVAYTGLVEVPMGTTLRQIIFDIGGGIPRGRKFKAAQIGGPSGGCVPPRYLDLPIDYDSLKEIGAIMGSGGLIVMDEATCMVDIARFFTDFVQHESCGKCTPCRVGTKLMLDTLTNITAGKGQPGDIDRLVQLGQMIKKTSLCGLGQTAPNPVLSTIRYFRDEYEAHIYGKRCPAHSCEALITTTCSDACPAHVNVPEYVALIAAGRFEEARDIIRRRNPFVSVCGRVCDHPCELFCRRGDIDEPVAIRHLKRFVSDIGDDPGYPPQWLGPRSGRVAVVGSGPAGLTAAYFLALMGRKVTVFEALEVVGGILAVGIPAYRLPKEALARDIEYIRRAGVQIETGHRIESLQELRDAGFDALCLAVGAHHDTQLGIPGEEMEGVHYALSFLRQVALGEVEQLSGAVAVIGGGNAAIDSARTALRLGASSVTVLYRRTEQEMPAASEEISEAAREGVNFGFLISPTAIEGDGRVEAVRCAQMTLGETDEDGRRRPVPKPGCETVVKADHVIVAIGQRSALQFVALDDSIAISEGRIVADPVTQRCGDSDVFAVGDAVTGPATVIEAIAAGQRAARSIDMLLGGKGELPADEGFAPRSKPSEAEAEIPRHPIPSLTADKCRHDFEEVVKGYSSRTAQAEARRCLRCDLE